jgi:hypothetical protein
MTNCPEPELTDESLRTEIELLGDVIVAVSLFPRPLTESELDQALGLPNRQPRAVMHRGTDVALEKHYYQADPSGPDQC